MEQSEIKINNKYRWKELTYKLIYPAFFGNMVYDFISFIQDTEFENWLLIVATGFILLFYMLDYVHLNVDLEKSVKEENKDWVYMVADIGVSIALFLAVAFIKFNLPEISIILLCIVPLFFAAYNIRLGLHAYFHKWFGGIAIILMIVFAIFFIFLQKTDLYCCLISYSLLSTSIILTLMYLYYNLKYFWIAGKIDSK